MDVLFKNHPSLESIWEVQDKNKTSLQSNFDLRNFDPAKFAPNFYGDGNIAYLILENLLTDKMVSILDIKLVATEMLSRYKTMQNEKKLTSYGKKNYLNIQGIQIVDKVLESPPRKFSDPNKRTSIYSNSASRLAPHTPNKMKLSDVKEARDSMTEIMISVNKGSTDDYQHQTNPFTQNIAIKTPPKTSSPITASPILQSTPNRKDSGMSDYIKMNTEPEKESPGMNSESGIRLRAGTGSSLNSLSVKPGKQTYMRRKSFFTKNLAKYDNLKTQARLIRRIFKDNEEMDSIDRQSLFKLKKEIFELKLAFQKYKLYHDFASVIIYYNSSLKKLDLYLIDLAYMPTRMLKEHEEFFDVMTKAIDLILDEEDLS